MKLINFLTLFINIITITNSNACLRKLQNSTANIPTTNILTNISTTVVPTNISTTVLPTNISNITTDPIIVLPTKSLVNITCSNNTIPVSVEGGLTGCSVEPICVANNKSGNCPIGSYCGIIVKTNVYGCKLNNITIGNNNTNDNITSTTVVPTTVIPTNEIKSRSRLYF